MENEKYYTDAEIKAQVKKLEEATEALDKLAKLQDKVDALKK